MRAKLFSTLNTIGIWFSCEKSFRVEIFKICTVLQIMLFMKNLAKFLETSITLSIKCTCFFATSEDGGAEPFTIGGLALMS